MASPPTSTDTMAETDGTSSPPPDPFELWRDWLNQSEQQLNRLLNEAMSSDAFGQASGRLMEIFLSFQRSMQQATELYFAALNIPTRTDVLSLGERLAVIEERLGSVESLLRALVPATATPPPRPRPKRTRQPPASGADAVSSDPRGKRR